MTPLTSTDPSDIANQARCFSSCVPGTAQNSLRTYLLTQVAGIATPPCITPTAPTLAGLTNSVTDGTILQASWKQLSNSGSLITGYTVFWGTVSGVYTNQSALLPVIPKQYLITGLTPGTLYFVAVKANSPISGCISVASNERSNTTGGVVTNGLLNSLISYWQFENVSAVSTPDSFGANTLGLSLANSGTAGGIINNCLDIGAGGSFANHASNSDLAMGLGVSFTYSCWFKATSWSTGGGFLTIICKGTPSVNSEYFIVGTPGDLYFYQAFDTANVLASIALGTPTNNVWHHFVIGFDASVNQIFSQFDNGVRVTTNTTTNGIRTSVDPFRFGEAAGQAFSNLAGGRVDEVGLWHRALTTSDVTNLYNGGAGLPLSSFQA